MTTHTHSFASWPFADPVDTVSYCTAKVAHERLPVLQVAHDWDGDWQFLDATTEEPGECVLLCLGCVVERDATLAEISDLPRGHGAFRPFVGAPWECWEKPHEADPGEEKALSDIAEHGLHIINVCGEDDLPPFSYSLGIEQSLNLPELIVVGLRAEVGQSVINACYEQMRSGTPIASGMRVSGLLGGDFECLLGEVSDTNRKQYMGWTSWLYKDAGFRAYQIIFPNTSGVFPWEAEASNWFRNWQPLLAD
ncbi:DUF4262 domain-containing protein [Massilia suwonensis]|uniref:DUF4262 domain-containing protein n=1 Tax=Massilia suwonensis TaxID=648895 RepID=A0ABW0MQ17_9BURK